MGRAQMPYARSRDTGSIIDAGETSLEQRLAEIELIYDAAPIGIFLCDRDFQFIRVNRHLAEEVDGIPIEQHIGRVVWDVVPGVQHAVEPLFRRVCDGEIISKLEVEGETPKRPGFRRTWEVSFYPIRDDRERIVAISGIVDEITDRKAFERARANAEARLQRLLDANLFGVLTGTGEQVTEANEAFLHLVGYSRQDFLRHGLDWRKITPLEHAAKDTAALTELKETGSCRPFEKEYVHKRGHRVPVVIGAALLDREPLRWIAFALDLSESKAREEHIRHLLQELTHRARNLIAVIQAIAHQIIATSTNLEEFDRQFSSRLEALAGIQDLLVQESWSGAPVRDLVLSQLAHCTEFVGHRILITGPAVSLAATACQYIGMALHELCTNAMKYGALSTETGTVGIRWLLRPSRRPEHFHIEWQESGGPAVAQPTRNGFGHRVLTRFVELALDAKVSYRHRPQGVRWSLTMPARFLLAGPDGRTRSEKPQEPAKENSNESSHSLHRRHHGGRAPDRRSSGHGTDIPDPGAIAGGASRAVHRTGSGRSRGEKDR